jgi:hypothetical protein
MKTNLTLIILIIATAFTDVNAQTTKTTTVDKSKNTTTTPSKGKTNGKKVTEAQPASSKGKGNAQPTANPNSKNTTNSNSTTTTKTQTVGSAKINIPQGNFSFEALDKYAKEIVEEKPNGKVNWSQQFVEAKGQSVIDTSRFKNIAQAKAMATRGAVVVAQRNLLEMTKGVNVVGETSVQDMITTSDYIYTRVDGIVKGAQQVGPAREVNGMMEVTLKMPIYGETGLASAFSKEDLSQARKRGGIANEEEVADAETPVAAGEEVVDGSKPIVFNFKGKQIDPSMFPVIVDEQGNVKLDFSKWYDGKTGKFPKYMQLGKEVMGDLGFKKGVDVIDLVQNSNGQFTVPQNPKKRVVWQKIGNVAQKIGKVLFSFL